MEENPKRIILPDREDTAKAVILCMGAHARSLGIPREEALVGAGVSYCATCDGAFFKEQAAAVGGGGGTAISDALSLSRFCTSVTVVPRRDEFRAAAVLVDKAKQVPNIHFALSSVPVNLIGECCVQGLEIMDLKTTAQRVLPVSGVFVAVGITPQSQLVKGVVDLNEGGSIITNELMKTNIPGVYAAGDIRNTPLRQVITACADGAVAATSALEFISCH